jgi:hypothetical protein
VPAFVEKSPFLESSRCHLAIPDIQPRCLVIVYVTGSPSERCTMEPCVICAMRSPDPANSGGDSWRYNCQRCGTYDISGSARSVADAKFGAMPNLRPVTSHIVRKMQRAGTPPMLSSDILARIWTNERLPTPIEQVNTLLELIGDRQPYADRYASFNPAVLAGALGTGDDSTRNETSGVDYVLKHAQTSGWLNTGPSSHSAEIGMRLTFSGWSRYDEIKHTLSTSHTAFMAMKFGDTALNKIYSECFKEAVQRTGFELRRLDEKQPAGLIDNQLRVAIRASRFLIADLTYGNQGAYWEAGFAEGLGKPVIYTCEKKHFETVRTHFDANHHLTIRWSVDDYASAADELAATIRNTLPSDAKLVDE